MVIPVIVRYDSESVAFINIIAPECPYVNFKHVNFLHFNNEIVIDLILAILIHRTTKYNVISEVSIKS